jgi:hypothetical protein
MPKTIKKNTSPILKPQIIYRESFRVKLSSLDSEDRKKIEKQVKRLASPHNLKRTSGFFSISNLRNGKRIVYNNSGEKVVFMDLLATARNSSSKRRIVK